MNKSDTPRTDAQFIGREYLPAEPLVTAKFARELERELNEANDRIRELESELEQCRQKTIELASELNHRARRTGK